MFLVVWSDVEYVLFVYFLGLDEVAVEEQFVEVGSDLIADLADHGVIGERL